MKKGSVLFLSITLICIAVIVVLIRWLIETYYIYIVLIITFSIMILKYSTEKEENKEETRKIYIQKDINTKKNKKKEKNIDHNELYKNWTRFSELLCILNIIYVAYSFSNTMIYSKKQGTLEGELKKYKITWLKV